MWLNNWLPINVTWPSKNEITMNYIWEWTRVLSSFVLPNHYIIWWRDISNHHSSPSPYSVPFRKPNLWRKPRGIRRRTVSEDRKRILTSTLCEPDLNWHREEILSNWERSTCSRIHDNNALDVPAWCTKVPVSNRPRATASTIQQPNS